MKFYLTDTQEKKEITIRSWDGSGYGPDCFNDLETNFKDDHDYDYDLDGFLCTSEEYEELKAWWIDEVDAMRNGTSAHDIDYMYPDDNVMIFAD